MPRIERNVWCSNQYLKTKTVETAQIANSAETDISVFILWSYFRSYNLLFFFAIIITFKIVSVFNDTCKGLTGILSTYKWTHWLKFCYLANGGMWETQEAGHTAGLLTRYCAVAQQAQFINQVLCKYRRELTPCQG